MKNLDFIAIDFETANASMDSAISIGLAIVDNMEITQTIYYLMRPPKMVFSKSNAKVHGLTRKDVENEPLFPEIWEQIKHLFNDGTIIVAHNASFDLCVLRSCFETYRIPLPPFYYADTIALTDPCIGSVDNKLLSRANYYGIPMGSHHNAKDDACTCASTLIAAFKASNKPTFEELLKDHYIYDFWEVIPSIKNFDKETKKPYGMSSKTIKEIAATVEVADTSHELFGKNVVLTGELQSLSREEAIRAVISLGANLKTAVSGKTDFLVVGCQDKTIVGDDGMSNKEEKAYALIEQGKDIKIIYEDEFLKLINQ